MSPRHAAFSLLETLVVVAVFAAILAFSVLYAQNDDVRTDLRTQAAIFVSYVRELQTDAASGKNDTSVGVHLELDRYVLFEGNSYNAGASDNFTVYLPSGITLINIGLNGGGSDIVFTQPLGETSTYGAFDFSADQIGQSVHVTLNSLGLIQYE